MLSEKLKHIAEYYALCGIDEKQVAELAGVKKFSDLPQEFNTYVDEVVKDYNEYCLSNAEAEDKIF